MDGTKCDVTAESWLSNAESRLLDGLVRMLASARDAPRRKDRSTRAASVLREGCAGGGFIALHAGAGNAVTAAGYGAGGATMIDSPQLC